MLAVGALCIALKANPDNSLVKFCIETADKLDLGCSRGPTASPTGRATRHSALTKNACVNWGLAAVVWLIVGKILERSSGRADRSSSLRFGTNHRASRSWGTGHLPGRCDEVPGRGPGSVPRIVDPPGRVSFTCLFGSKHLKIAGAAGAAALTVAALSAPALSAPGDLTADAPYTCLSGATTPPGALDGTAEHHDLVAGQKVTSRPP